MSNLKSKKSPGIDNLINGFFFGLQDILVPTFSRWFNAIFHSGNLSSSWSEGIILPLYKKDNSNDTNNFKV